MNEKLITEARATSKGCLMLDLTYRIKNWKDVLKIIDSDDVYDDDSGGYGLESEPHITVLYGFDKNVRGDNVEQLFENFTQNVKLKITGISIFENKEFDVVKFEVISEDLQKLHEICKKLPHELSFPDYHPHMTLAYVKKGTGQRYVKELDEPLAMEANAFIFSNPDRKKSEFKIKKKYRYNIDINGDGEEK